MALYADVDFTIATMSTKRDDDADLRGKVRRALMTVSRRVDGLFPLHGKQKRPYFEPYKEQRAYPVRRIDVNSLNGTFSFGDPLFELTAITQGALGNQITLTLGTDVELFPPIKSPSHMLRMLNAGRTWYDACGTGIYSPPYIYIDGIWGMHRDYASAWVEADHLTAAIDATTPTIPVDDADGADEFGFIPRFSEGMLLKVVTDDVEEYMEVIGTDTYDQNPTNNLTARRGVNGTTAIPHDNDAPVYVWRIDDALRRVIARQAALLYARRGAYTTVESTPAGGEVRYPVDMLVELKAELEEFAYGN